MWQIIYDDSAKKQLLKLDRKAQADILRYMRERIATNESPRRFGKALHSDMKGLWRYRVYDYRIICKIKDERLIVLVVTIDHRKDVYE
ncbi:MAG: type II toxin-antitoxin system RelE/ParE family toxin [Alphaproteobacteria bacterium]|nr:type II toxin-antitoxin system RelE/ParE family toxin [Alphaproteobacteria bacterium]